MIPSHASLPLADLERLICREMGHRGWFEEAGAPVTAFWICLRCGKFWR